MVPRLIAHPETQAAGDARENSSSCLSLTCAQDNHIIGLVHLQSTALRISWKYKKETFLEVELVSIDESRLVQHLKNL